jgi:hypothetical protein
MCKGIRRRLAKTVPKQIRPVGIHHSKIPNFVGTRSEKNLCPVSGPARVVGIIARDTLENVNLSRGNVDDGNMTRVRRVARFLRCVKRDASSIRRDRREYAVRDLFLMCRRDSLSRQPGRVQTRCADRRKNWRGIRGERKKEEDRSFHDTTVAKKVMASAITRTIRYTNPPNRNLKILKNQPWR